VWGVFELKKFANANKNGKNLQCLMFIHPPPDARLRLVEGENIFTRVVSLRNNSYFRTGKSQEDDPKTDFRTHQNPRKASGLCQSLNQHYDELEAQDKETEWITATFATSTL